jgi:CBS domain-containing protein
LRLEAQRLQRLRAWATGAPSWRRRGLARTLLPWSRMHKHLTVEDLMRTAVIALKSTDTVAAAREQMRMAEIRHIPVVDQHNRVVGIVSERDLRAATRPKMLIADIMRHPVRMVRPSTAAHEAASILLEHKIGSLPVIGADEQLVGIVTESDFVAVAREALGGAAAR